MNTDCFINSHWIQYNPLWRQNQMKKRKNCRKQEKHFNGEVWGAGFPANSYGEYGMKRRLRRARKTCHGAGSPDHSAEISRRGFCFRDAAVFPVFIAFVVSPRRRDPTGKRLTVRGMGAARTREFIRRRQRNGNRIFEVRFPTRCQLLH